MNNMAASIVIPTKDKNSRLRLVLLALESQVTKDIEVVIVFDGCKEKTIEEFDKLKFSFSPVKVICQKNVGRSAARNLGIKKASGKIIIFLDDDRIPGPGFVSSHLAGHKEHCVVLGCRQEVEFTEEEINGLYHSNVIKDNFEQIKTRAKENVDSPNSIPRKFFYNNKFVLKWMNFLTGNSSVLKEDLLKAGLFDEKMVLWGHEDLDIGYRLYKLRIPYYQNVSIVNYHLTHSQDFMKNWLESKVNALYLKKKYQGEFVAQIGLTITLGIIKYYELKAQIMNKKDNYAAQNKFPKEEMN